MVTIIREPILLGAELAAQTIFEIQIQISRQTSPQFRLAATIVLFFQQDHNKSNVTKHYPSI